MFSLDWFITPAGIFMTVGVLLLIIALVIFIVTKSKGKKDNKEDKKGTVVEPSITAVPAGPTPLDASVAPQTVAAQPTVAPTPDTGMPMDSGLAQATDNGAMTTGVEVPNVYSTDPVDNNMNSATMPVDNYNGAVVGQDMNAGMSMNVPQVELPDAAVSEESPIQTMEAPEMPSVYSTEQPAPTVQTPVVEQPSPQPEISMPEQVAPGPVAAVPDANMMNNGTIGVPSVEQVMPEIEQPVAAAPAATEQVVANPAPYGGADMSVPTFETQPAQQPQIYGGANPLENTQQVAISDITAGMNNQASVAGQPAVQEAVPQPVVQTPAQPVVAEQPSYAVPNVQAEVQPTVEQSQATYQAATPQVQIPGANNIQQ